MASLESAVARLESIVSTVPPMSPTSIAAAAFAVAVSYKILRSGSREHGLPPGPRTIPILGNLLQMPTKDMHLRITEWAREYGEIISLMVGSHPFIILSSPTAIKDILDRQSAYTADRPENTLFELVHEGWNLFLCRYGERWRKLRKAAQVLLAPSVVKDYRPLQEAETTQLVFDILNTPDEFYTHIHRVGSSIALSIIYGKRNPRIVTPTAVAIDHITEDWNAFLQPGNTPPVDAFPFSKRVPFLLRPWTSEARKIQKMQKSLYLELFDECRKRVEAGDGAFFMGDVVRDRANHGLSREQMSSLAGSIYEAGSETTPASLRNWLLLVAAHPEVQAKAQDEIDRVVGEGRMPEYKDAEDMPYLRAIIQEAHRFRNIVPLGLPHRAMRDLRYKDYLIPQGATILANLHGLFRDPELFDDPYTFNPERYMLSEHGTKPGINNSDVRTSVIFGFGRRICPGMHLANATALLVAMKLLWAFEFRAPLDPATGKPIPYDILTNRDGISAAPPPFKCDIRCRSPARAEIIRHAFSVDATPTLSAYEYNLSQGDKDWLESVRTT
ncbi:cytochrome P450 [Schizophyllum fasciatum]